jgi:hypothetical protein
MKPNKLKRDADLRRKKGSSLIRGKELKHKVHEGSQGEKEP